MKLLLDENLSRKLPRRVDDLFPESAQVSEVGLLHAADWAIWEFARENGFCIVSADSDFYDLSTTLGPPPKVIWLKGCDYPTDVAEDLLRSQSIRIVEFLNDPEGAVLILSKPIKSRSR